ncbi:MAG: hypothetical protein NVSMB57_02020 [Actinomycetota bacterium]
MSKQLTKFMMAAAVAALIAGSASGGAAQAANGCVSRGAYVRACVVADRQNGNVSVRTTTTRERSGPGVDLGADPRSVGSSLPSGVCQCLPPSDTEPEPPRDLR